MIFFFNNLGGKNRNLQREIQQTVIKKNRLLEKSVYDSEKKSKNKVKRVKEDKYKDAKGNQIHCDISSIYSNIDCNLIVGKGTPLYYTKNTDNGVTSLLKEIKGTSKKMEQTVIIKF